LAQAGDLARDHEIFVAAESDAVFCGETLGAFGDEIDVRAIAQDLAGGTNRIAQALDASNAATAQG